jgi:hypothetical protein
MLSCRDCPSALWACLCPLPFGPTPSPSHTINPDVPFIRCLKATYSWWCSGRQSQDQRASASAKGSSNPNRSASNQSLWSPHRVTNQLPSGSLVTCVWSPFRWFKVQLLWTVYLLYYSRVLGFWQTNWRCGDERYTIEQLHAHDPLRFEDQKVTCPQPDVRMLALNGRPFTERLWDHQATL